MEESESNSENQSFKKISSTWNRLTFDIMFETWWDGLLEQNKLLCTTAPLIPTILPNKILEPEVVEVIFDVTTKLFQPPECRFLAVELFDMFLGLHYKELHGRVFLKKDIALKKTDNDRWKSVVQQVKSQALLRILSCIQIASKVVSNSQSLSPKNVVDQLGKMNQNLTLQHVLASEQRVFRTLQYKIPFSTVLTYVEYLVQFLRNTVADCDVLFNACVTILDVVYILHHQVYKRLFHLLTTRWVPRGKERVNFVRDVESDKIYLASSVVVTAAALSDGHNPELLSQLSAFTKLPSTDIEGLASIITELVLS